MNKFFKNIKERFSFYVIRTQKEPKPKRILSKKEKVIKYTSIFLLPTLAIASGVILGFRDYNEKNNSQFVNQVEVSTSGVKRKIFLVSSDNLTIPITVTLNQRTTLQQEILDVFDLLKTSSKANSKYVSGFINDQTKINSVKLEERILELDLSEDFLTNQYNDVNVIEALTLTFLQFDEIDEVKLYVQGELLNSYNNVPLPTSLTENFGINTEIIPLKDMINKEKMVVFAKREYDQSNSYLVPVTVYVEECESVNKTFTNACLKESFTTSNLIPLDIYQGISSNQDVSEQFNLNVNTSSLVDENYVNKELFDLINMSLDLMNIDEVVSFTLEGESVQVDGVFELENYQVSSFIINETKI